MRSTDCLSEELVLIQVLSQICYGFLKGYFNLSDIQFPCLNGGDNKSVSQDCYNRNDICKMLGPKQGDMTEPINWFTQNLFSNTFLSFLSWKRRKGDTKTRSSPAAGAGHKAPFWPTRIKRQGFWEAKSYTSLLALSLHAQMPNVRPWVEQPPCCHRATLSRLTEPGDWKNRRESARYLITSLNHCFSPRLPAQNPIMPNKNLLTGIQLGLPVWLLHETSTFGNNSCHHHHHQPPPHHSHVCSTFTTTSCSALDFII